MIVQGVDAAAGAAIALIEDDDGTVIYDTTEAADALVSVGWAAFRAVPWPDHDPLGGDALCRAARAEATRTMARIIRDIVPFETVMARAREVLRDGT
jgi:hypothetical protein